MFISFTQTYSDRLRLLEIASKDKKLIELKNNIDLNVYAFHNSPSYVIPQFKKMNPVKNIKILKFGTNDNRVPFRETVQRMKEFMKKNNCTHFFFCQDDGFSVNNDLVNMNELVEFVRGIKKNFVLSLSVQVRKDYSDKILHEGKTFTAYNYNTYDHKNVGLWPFDDQPYICTTDMLDIIYDQWYLRLKDIWECEMYLKQKFGKINIPRHVVNEVMFRNYNILGRSINPVKKQSYMEQLKKKGMI